MALREGVDHGESPVQDLVQELPTEGNILVVEVEVRREDLDLGADPSVLMWMWIKDDQRVESGLHHANQEKVSKLKEGLNQGPQLLNLGLDPGEDRGADHSVWILMSEVMILGVADPRQGPKAERNLNHERIERIPDQGHVEHLLWNPMLA